MLFHILPILQVRNKYIYDPTDESDWEWQNVDNKIEKSWKKEKKTEYRIQESEYRIFGFWPYLFVVIEVMEKQDTEGKIGILIDFPSGLSALLRVSTPACCWQPSGRNDI